MSRSERGPRNHRTDRPSGDRPPRTAGFTLIEVLVALAIVLLAMGTLYRMASTSLAAGEMAERYSRALLIAEAALQSVGLGETPQPGSFEQQVDHIYDRDIVVRARPDLINGATSAPRVYPYEISVRVAWRDGAKTRSIALSTIRLGPPR